MSLRVYSVFVLSCVGNRLATGLIPRPRGPDVYEIQVSELILNGNRPEGLMDQGRRRIRPNSDKERVRGIAE
jgi:hypothetical protein